MKNNLINKNEQIDDSLRNDPLFNKIESRMKFYELLVNASSDGMLSINMDGIITFINWSRSSKRSSKRSIEAYKGQRNTGSKNIRYRKKYLI